MVHVLVKADGESGCVAVRAETDALKAGDLCVAEVAGRRRFGTVRAVFRAAAPGAVVLSASSPALPDADCRLAAE